MDYLQYDRICADYPLYWEIPPGGLGNCIVESKVLQFSFLQDDCPDVYGRVELNRDLIFGDAETSWPKTAFPSSL